MSNEAGSYRVYGRTFGPPEIALIRDIVTTCGGVSRKELANTIAELLAWTRPSGALKEPECLALLARLEGAGLVRLPAKQHTKPVGSVTSIPQTLWGQPGPPLTGRVDAFAPVHVDLVQTGADRRLFRELLGRYHYLSYKVPFGASLRYLIAVSTPAPTVVGCLQWSSAAWRMRARDAWIGWDDATRAQHLPRVVNNSRFLLVPKAATFCYTSLNN